MAGNESKNTLYCSFCGKSQHQVIKLIAGPSVFICNECVDLCAAILDNESTPGAEDRQRHMRAVARAQAAFRMVSIVRTLLSTERQRHEPFEQLAQELADYEATAPSDTQDVQPFKPLRPPVESQ